MKMSRLLVAAIVVITMALSVPTIAAETKTADTEINLGGGTPLWGTHTDDDSNGLDGGWLFFASIDKKVETKKWLSYGLMYNYTRIKLKEYEESTMSKQYDREWRSTSDVDCLSCDDFPVYNTTTTKTKHDWLQVHVLGPYAKPTWQMTKRIEAFAMVGMGVMYVDGPIYGDEFGGAGFASVGLGLDITERFGLGAQVLYVKGATSHVDDIDYLAPVLTLKFSF